MNKGTMMLLGIITVLSMTVKAGLDFFDTHQGQAYPIEAEGANIDHTPQTMDIGT